ncbi:MAG: coproporphyrinogen III oxidase family protein [bacterium]|nr:coproporphyrinogen III oxidase family protein [bacterium]
MSERDPATSVGVDHEKTGVGSVFVSNYPPYSFWGEDQRPRIEEVLDAPGAQDARLGLYIHIPFCRRRCKFCYFKVYTDKNARDVSAYVDAVVREVELYAARRVFAGRKLSFVYFGGGTPSFLSAKHLSDLVARVKQVFPWDAVEEVTFECEPGTLTRPKLETIRDVGVTRISLGVENFNDKILEDNGRAHVSREIYRVAPWIQELNFDQLNIDLISGMVGETWDTWKDSIRKTVEMDPDSVTIYQMELPFNTVYSRGVLDGGAVPVADWATKREWHAYAIEQLESAGYGVSSAYTMLKQDGRARFAYRDALWHGADLLGLGVSSFSHVGGVHFQNLSRWESYLETVGAGQFPVSRAYATSARERLTRELILQLKLGRVDLSYFSKKFGIDPQEEFADAFRRLTERGMLQVDRGVVTLSRTGLLQVDLLLPEFYAPEHQNARYT